MYLCQVFCAAEPVTGRTGPGRPRLGALRGRIPPPSRSRTFRARLLPRQELNGGLSTLAICHRAAGPRSAIMPSWLLGKYLN